MTKKNRPVTEFTDEVIAAFKAADFHRLHRALGLSPWNASPLPIEIHGLGVSQEIRRLGRRMKCIVVIGSMRKRCRPSCWKLQAGPIAVKLTKRI